jgi:hypothetical protein
VECVILESLSVAGVGRVQTTLPSFFNGCISATIYPMTHRIVIDTNIFLGACLGQGAARHVVAAWPACAGNANR